jgi:hypothetical protein
MTKRLSGHSLPSAKVTLRYFGQCLGGKAYPRCPVARGGHRLGAERTATRRYRAEVREGGSSCGLANVSHRYCREPHAGRLPLIPVVGPSDDERVTGGWIIRDHVESSLCQRDAARLRLIEVRAAVYDPMTRTARQRLAKRPDLGGGQMVNACDREFFVGRLRAERAPMHTIKLRLEVFHVGYVTCERLRRRDRIDRSVDPASSRDGECEAGSGGALGAIEAGKKVRQSFRKAPSKRYPPVYGLVAEECGESDVWSIVHSEAQHSAATLGPIQPDLAF